MPSDNAIGIAARIVEPIPAGATVTWTWSHSGVGSITTVPVDADKPDSSINFNSGATEGLASFSVSARVVVAGAATPVLPVTRSTLVKKGLRQLVIEVGGCNFPVTYQPHSSTGAKNAYAVWIGFGGPFSGKCVVTITLSP